MIVSEQLYSIQDRILECCAFESQRRNTMKAIKTNEVRNVVRENRKADVYLRNPEGGVVFIPQGWCDEFEQDADSEPEIMTYASVGLGENGPVDNLYITISCLNAMRQISETEARELHPFLFDVLARINNGEDVALGYTK